MYKYVWYWFTKDIKERLNDFSYHLKLVDTIIYSGKNNSVTSNAFEDSLPGNQ